MRLTDAEWHIMHALWERHPLTARNIVEHLPAGVSWAYTTVKTLLSRLCEKQAVSECKRGNTSLYEPLLTRTKARRNALRALADRAFNGAFGPLLHFLVEEEGLSDKERRELLDALKKHERPPKGGRP